MLHNLLVAKTHVRPLESFCIKHQLNYKLNNPETFQIDKNGADFSFATESELDLAKSHLSRVRDLKTNKKWRDPWKKVCPTSKKPE